MTLKRSKLKNIADKMENPNDMKNYEKPRNYAVNLNKTAKSEYLNRYNSKESKLFWVSCKPYPSSKHNKTDTAIILIENGELVFKNNKITDTFNEYLEPLLKILLFIIGSTILNFF